MYANLKPYSVAALAGEFGMESWRAFHVIEGLMARGIVRYRTDKSAKDTDAFDEDGAKDDERYQFNFVGRATVAAGVAMIAYPKYFKEVVPSRDELRQVMRLLKRDAGRAIVPTLSDDGEADLTTGSR